MPDNKLLHFYRTPALSPYKRNVLVNAVRERIWPDVADIETEFCFNIETSEPLTQGELKTLRWLLAETFEPQNFSDRSFLANPSTHAEFLFEVGPAFEFYYCLVCQCSFHLPCLRFAESKAHRAFEEI